MPRPAARVVAGAFSTSFVPRRVIRRELRVLTAAAVRSPNKPLDRTGCAGRSALALDGFYPLLLVLNVR